VDTLFFEWFRTLPFLDDSVIAFQQLSDQDNEITEIIVSKIIPSFKSLVKQQKMSSLAGSIAEGGFSAGLFFKDPLVHGNILANGDIDYEMNVMEIPDTFKHCIVDRPQTGFLNVQVANKTCQHLLYHRTCCKYHYCNCEINYHWIRHHGQIVDKAGFLCSYQIKDFYLKNESSVVRECEKARTVLALLLDVRLKRISVQMEHNVTKATYQRRYKGFVDGQLKIMLTIDISLVFKLEWTVDAILPWIKRKRLWPNVNMLKREVESSWVIGKPANNEKQNRSTRSFRYSFSHLERAIIKLQSKRQRSTYYMAKSLYSKWVKPISEKLTSFLVKNTFFWVCEEYPPEHEFWEDSRTAIENSLKYLFSKMLTHLRECFMPYYFIRKVNVLENVSKSSCKKAASVVQRTMLDIYRHLPGNTGEVANLLEKLRVYVYDTANTLSTVQDHGLWSIAGKKKNAPMVIMQFRRKKKYRKRKF